MIIAKLFGGLGNQMFIYAASKGIADKASQDLYFDTRTGFKYDQFGRTFALSQFGIKLKEADKLKSFQYPLGRVLRRLSRMIGICIPYLNFRFLTEEIPYHYEVDFMRLPLSSSFYLEGYFQSYKYFEDIREQLMVDFKFPNYIINSVEEEKNVITQSSFVPVAIGIRRYSEMKGQYGDLKVLNLEYYERAVEYITTVVSNPMFVVFSEDINWVKDNLKLPYPVYFVKPKSGELSPFQDMYLMSLCSHHIISNSTFYWWGAYLASNTNHIVIAPSIFLNRDCVPNDWIII